jgi:hypothetical protein
MNRQSINEKDAALAIQHEAVKEIRSALDKISSDYERKLNRKPTIQELDTMIKGALEALESQQAANRQEGQVSQCQDAEGESSRIGYSCMADKPCTCRISSFEAAERIADEIVKGTRQCRFISGEMRVESDGETTSLTEEQVLSDGTRILGRSFTFDSRDEAIEAVAKILWESAKLFSDASVLTPSESQESDSC